MSHVLIELYWRDTADHDPGLPRQLFSTLETLTKLHPDITKWRWVSLQGEEKTVESAASCSEALQATRQPWQVGHTTRHAFGPKFIMSGFSKPPVEINAVLGIGVLPKLPTWVPSRLQLILRADKFTDRPTVEGAVRALVGIWNPDWALVAVGGVPIPPSAPLDDGTPVVGWITYLSNRYAEIPHLPVPAVSYPLDRGTLIAARPEFDPGRHEHVESIHAVRAALTRAGVLIPAYALPEPRAS